MMFAYALKRMAIGLSVLTSALVAPMSPASAQPGEIVGDCSDYSFVKRFGDQKSNRTGQTAFVLRDKAPLFDGPEGDTVVGHAAFSDPVSVVEVVTLTEQPDERVGVSLPLESPVSEKTYWMSRQDLLCRSIPLRDEKTRLERKALVRTQTAERQDGVVQAISAFRNPDLSDVQIDESRRLSRFTTYLIYAESDQAYLLVERFNLASINDKLVGWVSKKDVLNWNWAIGLRPPIKVSGGAGPAGGICGYESPTDRSNCVPILGGNRWFRSDQRLPVIDVLADSYHVVGAASGIGGGEIVDGKLKLTSDMLKKLQINPSETGGIKEEKLLAFNQVDLFFLIDGTRSMMPYIDAIRGNDTKRGVVDTIVRAIEQRGGGASMRAGFRVFRDSTKDGPSGVDEAYPLGDDNCNDENAQARKDERTRFDRYLRSINPSKNDSDDYDENLYGGLLQAALDMQGCPDRQKLLFVISDAGYDAAEQKKRGHDGLEIEDFIDFLRENEKLTAFFIRPPKQERAGFPSDKSYQLYTESWNEYQELGTRIIGEVLSRDATADLNPDRTARNYFFNLAPGADAPQDMIAKISDSVREVARPDVINEIMIDLRGGAALENVIERLQRERVDVPILFFNMIKRTVCAESEAACRERIFDGVFDLYIPKTEPHTLDAWLTSDQLKDWTSLLRMITRATELSLPQERKAMQQVISNALQDVLKMPTPENLGEDIATFLARSGRLPGPVKTPFLRYTFEELDNEEKLTSCEINRLKVWLQASNAMLGNVLNQMLSDYAVEKPDTDCPLMTAQGRELKYIRDTPQGVPAGPDPSYHLGAKFLGEIVYWVPLEYLP